MTAMTPDIRDAIRAGLIARPQPTKHPRRTIIATTGEDRRIGGCRYEYERESLGVDPDQVEEVQAIYKAHGLPFIEHTPDGTPIVTSEGQFHKMWQARGWKTGRDGYDNVRNATGREPERLRHEAIQQFKREHGLED